MVKTGHFCQKTQKRRLFGPKMTSYVKNRQGTTKIFFSKGQAHQTEQLFIRQFWLNRHLKQSKLAIFVKKRKIDVFLDQKWRHTSKKDIVRQKIFFQKVELIKPNNFFYDSFGLKGIQNGQNWSFLSKTQKKRFFKNDVISQKWWKLQKKFFLQNIQKLKGNNFL